MIYNLLSQFESKNIKNFEIVIVTPDTKLIANMKEKEKIAYYATQILKVERPEMTTIKWNNELKKIITFISNYVEIDGK